jgi:membrane fusion protein, multidrug efflux system
VPLEIRGIGNVEAYSTVAVKSRVAGQLLKVYVEDGREVRKGQLLFDIDPLPFEQQVKRLEATIARDRAAEKQAEAAIARSRAQERQARAQATRYETLQKEGIASREQTEQFRAAADAADAAVQADVSALESARASIRAMEAQLAEANLQLSYTRIVSPINGRIGAVAIKEGNLVKENDTAPLVTILQVRPIYVSFAVPERSLDAIRREMRSGKLPVVATPEGGSAPVTGHLEFIDNSVDTTTGTIRVKASFPNHSAELWPGQFANVVLRLETERDVLVVPKQAVQTRQEGPYVWVARADSTAEIRPVQVARTHEDLAVVASGVQPGERVVTEGLLRLTPGAKLQVSDRVLQSGPVPGTSPAQATP